MEKVSQKNIIRRPFQAKRYFFYSASFFFMPYKIAYSFLQMLPWILTHQLTIRKIYFFHQILPWIITHQLTIRKTHFFLQIMLWILGHQLIMQKNKHRRYSSAAHVRSISTSRSHDPRWHVYRRVDTAHVGCIMWRHVRAALSNTQT